MKRWHLYIAASLIAVLLVAVGTRHVLRERARRGREIEYGKALRSYSEVLKTGMSRKQVEDYLSAKNISYRQMCCGRGVYDNAYDDLVKIGQEDAPWFCSENNVYLAFQFLGSEKDGLPRAEASDKLKNVTIYHWLDGCL